MVGRDREIQKDRQEQDHAVFYMLKKKFKLNVDSYGNSVQMVQVQVHLGRCFSESQ